MFLLLGIAPVALALVIFLHFVFFRHIKIVWLNWLILILVSGGVTALLGVGGLHAGLLGLLTFLIGAFWLGIFQQIVQTSQAKRRQEKEREHEDSRLKQELVDLKRENEKLKGGGWRWFGGKNKN